MKVINGGVSSAKGFKAAGIHCGVKADSGDKKDLALIVSECMCSAAATFTTNKVKAAPVYLSMNNIKDGQARAIVCNSGNANACAPNGEEHAAAMCRKTADVLGVELNDVLVASTGVIGHEINIDAIISGIPEAAAKLSEEGGEDASYAMMTTDLVNKQVCVEIELDGKKVTVGGAAKGSGMIHPNMGTMLCFITTDADVDNDILSEILKESVRVTFNRISVDGDTSTNDTCIIMANGLAGNPKIASKGADYEIFKEAVGFVCKTLAVKIAKDGEGATKLITCKVKGASSEAKAETISMSVIKSPLVKTAMFGEDANWGRVLCAMGYSGEEFDPLKVTVGFSSKAGSIDVCTGGKGLEFDEDKASEILAEEEITIDITMQEGDWEVTAWGCDLTYDYVKINGDYRT
ncbi:MAG: bifunctional glutamate N-acetyltransferase/amino-acid acetyltransferase ArgJ [Bacillota bacterium]|nr:bifunctional glutamate N-acetyltransferase/amino-acid acetyltransferase ArgJ [Bacillota bacterium]